MNCMEKKSYRKLLCILSEYYLLFKKGAFSRVGFYWRADILWQNRHILPNLYLVTNAGNQTYAVFVAKDGLQSSYRAVFYLQKKMLLSDKFQLIAHMSQTGTGWMIAHECGLNNYTLSQSKHDSQQGFGWSLQYHCNFDSKNEPKFTNEVSQVGLMTYFI